MNRVIRLYTIGLMFQIIIYLLIWFLTEINLVFSVSPYVVFGLFVIDLISYIWINVLVDKATSLDYVEENKNEI